MSLKELGLQSVYSSEKDSLLHDFYIPALGQAVCYDRAVGYFSASTLSYAAQGLSAFIERRGRIRLLIGDPLDVEEYEAIIRGVNLKDLHRRLNTKIELVLNNVDHPLFKNRLELLSWLVAAEQLEIRIALTVRGLYHDKIGVFTDELGDKIVFQGSANETSAALLPDFNYETIAVYPSWKTEIFQEYGEPQADRFERLWNGQAPKLRTIPLPSRSYEMLRNYHHRNTMIEPLEVREPHQSVQGMDYYDPYPKLPTKLAGSRYQLLTHQLDALTAWKARDFRGILALATGAGKTITALHGAVKLAAEHYRNGRNFVLIVSVPYQVLADQWCDVMRGFNMEPIRCYRSRDLWHLPLNDAVSQAYLNKKPRFLCAVVVNNTLVRDEFQAVIQRVNVHDMMFIGDECHHHASPSIQQKLPIARYRLGLSATPWSTNEAQRKEGLRDYYGGIAATYSLGSALKDDVLVPYEYLCHQIRLSGEESDIYQSLSEDIGRLYAIKEQGGPVNEDHLDALRGRRARLLGSAEAKFTKLEELVSSSTVNKHTLFYCGDGSIEVDSSDRAMRDVERCATVVGGAGWKTSRFTAEESHSERGRIMENFRFGFIDGVVAIRVLDEGFDMPACRQAFLLASSSNERQFIQRRGRILRKAPGKSFATIHDFLILPQRGSRSDTWTALVKQELMRCIEFARYANNGEDAWAEIKDAGEYYGISVETLITDVEAKEVVPE